MMAMQSTIILCLTLDLVQVMIFTCIRMDQTSIYDLDMSMSLAIRFYLVMDCIPSKISGSVSSNWEVIVGNNYYIKGESNPL